MRDKPADRPGWGLPEDQVASCIRFSEAHPEITFTFMRDIGRWEATCPAGQSGTQKICFTELRHVLDELEKRLGETRPSQPGKITGIADRRNDMHEGPVSRKGTQRDRAHSDQRTGPARGGPPAADAHEHACPPADETGDDPARAAGTDAPLCRAAEPTAPALPRRNPGATLAATPGRQTRQRPGPGLLRRVLDGLNRL